MRPMDVTDSELKETVDVVSEIVRAPLVVEKEGAWLELISGDSKVIKARSNVEMFRVLQGILLGYQKKERELPRPMQRTKFYE